MKTTQTALKKAEALEAYLVDLARELREAIPESIAYDATPELEDVRHARRQIEDAIEALKNHVPVSAV